MSAKAYNGNSPETPETCQCLNVEWKRDGVKYSTKIEALKGPVSQMAILQAVNAKSGRKVSMREIRSITPFIGRV